MDQRMRIEAWRPVAAALLVGLSLGVGLENARQDEPKVASAKSLLGSWKIDLRPTPDSEPYYKEFVIDSVEGKTFKGTFYGTPIESGYLNKDWGTVKFAFVTRDGSGLYNHSGTLKDGKLEGLSHSIGREFLSVWSGVREN